MTSRHTGLRQSDAVREKRGNGEAIKIRIILWLSGTSNRVSINWVLLWLRSGAQQTCYVFFLKGIFHNSLRLAGVGTPSNPTRGWTAELRGSGRHCVPKKRHVRPLRLILPFCLRPWLTTAKFYIPKIKT